MNVSSISDLTDHVSVPSPSSAFATVASTVEDLTDHVPDVELPDLSRAFGRTRGFVAGVVPWMSDGRSTRRWVSVAAVSAVVAAVVAVLLVRRRSGSTAPTRRDDWSAPTGNGDSHTARPAADRDLAMTGAPTGG